MLAVSPPSQGLASPQTHLVLAMTGCCELSHVGSGRLGPLASGQMEMALVRIAQFDTILNEPSVIIIQMRVNTCLPESVPRVIPHLETRITDTSFIQNNIKSGSPGMCSNIRLESAYAHTVYNRIHRQ